MRPALTRRRYRQLVLAWVAIVAIDIAVSLGGLGSAHSPLLAAAYDSEPSRFQRMPLPLLALELLVAGGLLLAATVGLYRCRHWGRVLGLWCAALTLPWMAWSGPLLYTGLEAGLDSLQATLWGALLALAWYGPVGAVFDASRTSPVVEK